MEELNYENVWNKLSDSNHMECLLYLNKLLSKRGGMDRLNGFTDKHEDTLWEIYLRSVQEKREEIMFLSFKQFGMTCFVEYVLKPEVNLEDFYELEEEKQNVEPKPQSKKLQKELDNIYTKENIDSELEGLGIFTKEDLDDNKGEQK